MADAYRGETDTWNTWLADVQSVIRMLIFKSLFTLALCHFLTFNPDIEKYR
jgi:hypothetical protein